MLGQEVMLFGALGILTSAFMAFFVRGDDKKIIIICSLQGAFTGWLAGMIWVYLTGGLEITLYALVMPVLISAFFTFMILQRVPHETGNPVGKGTSALATIGLFAIVFFVAFSSVPVAYKQAINTEAFSISTLDYSPETTTITKTDTPPAYSIPMTIEYSKSTIGTFGVMSENAMPQSSIQFKVFFKPGAEWIKPYVTIGVYADKDRDGKLSKGDVLWSDTNYELATTNSNWRTNCLWETCSNCQNELQPRYGMISNDGKLLPVFHAATITQTKDEANVRFLNTPDGYTPQNDMLTWEDGVLKEQIIEYASITAGESSGIQGQIYCGPQTSGDNIIVVRAYCACLTDPFADNQQPLAEQVIPFAVTPMGEDVTIMGIPPIGILLGLGILLGVGLLYAKKEGML
jgi:hypothetical protein